ncbi:TPA: dTDP-4-dehydrorhamnose 3,5-epimerase, partial [Escherichia coli]
YNKNKFTELGINLDFVQDNRSSSSQNVLRGLHFQKTKPQGKLVTVTKGEVFDVAVDLRKDSRTFGQYESVILTEENKKIFYIPPGFAHGFCVLSNKADFLYKCTDFYDPNDEGGIIWNDSSLSIEWPVNAPILSKKDMELPTLKNIRQSLLDGF